MSFKAQILQAHKSIVVESDESILQAAKRSQIPYPHSCSSGRCGACKSRLVSGEIAHLNHNPATLDDEEKLLGLFLACRAQPKSDVVVSWLEESEETLPVQKFKALVVENTPLTHDIRELVLQVPEGMNIRFKPGQFANLSVNGFASRSYSMANQPGDRELHFFIRLSPGGTMSTFVHQHLHIGDTLDVEGPFGVSYLRTDHTGPILAIAGGSGIAPIYSIVNSALNSGFKQPIHLYFGVRSVRDLFLHQELRKLSTQFSNFQYQAILGEQHSSLRSGRVGDELLKDYSEFKGLWQVYLAGPPPMIEFIVPKLTEKGVRKHNIFADPFYFQNKASNS